MKQRLLELLQEEKVKRFKGGLYHQTQIKLAYNSNRIEGSRLQKIRPDTFMKPIRLI